MTEASKKFQADARAFLGGYADEAATARVEKLMETGGMDEKALRRQLDEVNDWLTDSAPQLRAQVQTFKRTAAEVEPVVKQHFPWLDDPKSPEYPIAQQVLQLVPELKQRSPAWRFAQGVFVLGMKEYQKLKATAGNGAAAKKLFLPGRKPPQVAPKAGSPVNAPRTTRKDAETEQASENLRKAPTAENMEATLKAALG